MPNKHNILCLDIYGKPEERIPILEGNDVKRLAEGLKTAYELNGEMVWEIYFYRPSKMNKDENSEQDNNG